MHNHIEAQFTRSSDKGDIHIMALTCIRETSAAGIKMCFYGSNHAQILADSESFTARELGTEISKHVENNM